MNDKHTSDEPVDIVTVTADDELLDLLGRGEPAPDGDDLATMLAAWRTDLADDLPVVRSAAVPPPATVTPIRRRRRRALLAVAAGVVALAGAVTVAAADARPGSPLWPITRVVFADHAASVLAEQDVTRTIQQAREAIADARYTDAARLLDQATARTKDIEDPTVVQRLLDEVAAVRGLLPGGLLAPTPSPSASAGSSSGGAGGGGGGTGTSTTPAPSTTSGGLLPLPSLPTITLPVLPSVTL